MSKLEEALEAWRKKYPVGAQATDCPVGSRSSQDQYRCSKCGLVWDIDEIRPSCLSSISA